MIYFDCPPATDGWRYVHMLLILLDGKKKKKTMPRPLYSFCQWLLTEEAFWWG